MHLNNGRSVMVPIATISEGIDTGNPGRHALIRPLHIAGCDMDAETLNDQVEACLNGRYDINAVESLCVRGDGAARIVSLGERFPNGCHVLDWSTAFSACPASFGEVDAVFVIHKALGFMRPIA